jgi:DNA-binding MarR family transcriptional regulator
MKINDTIPCVSLDARVCPSGDEKVRLFALLIETNARLERTLGLELESACDLPLAWFEVLLTLRQAPDERLKMNQIADAIVHSTGGTTRLIDRLEDNDLVVRQACAGDRRAIYVALTEAGGAKLDEALAVHLDYLETHLAGRLSASERTTLSNLLEKLNA